MLCSSMLFRALCAFLIVSAFMLNRDYSHAVGAKSPPYLVLIVIDGFRPDYATLAPMHHLRALMARGISFDTAWVGQMESETPSGHATIATGVYPRKHGVVGFGYRDTSTGGFTYMPTNLPLIRSGKLTRLMEQGGAPTISDLIHTRHKQDLAVSVSGEKYYASATMGAGADYVLYGKNFNNIFRPVVISRNVPPASTRFMSIKGDSSLDSQDAFSASLGTRLATTLKPRALLVNLPDADIAGHYFGGIRAPRDMASIMRAADSAIGLIVNTYRRMGLFDRTLFVVTADHGMASNRHIVPTKSMYAAVRESGISWLDEEYRITTGSIWLRDPQQAPVLATKLAPRAFRGVEGVLYKSGSSFVAEPNTRSHLAPSLLNAYLRLAGTEAGPTGPDVVLPYGEDTTGLVVKDRKRWGSHGGFSWGVQHIPLILAGPGVHRGVSHFPAKLVDVAPTVERLLGLPIPSAVDGVVLSDALSHASPEEKTAAQSVRRQRLQDVKALRSHSLAQGGSGQ